MGADVDGKPSPRTTMRSDTTNVPSLQNIARATRARVPRTTEPCSYPGNAVLHRCVCYKLDENISLYQGWNRLDTVGIIDDEGGVKVFLPLFD
jgi:hypothetical protein